jgi:sugar lactone lactonase YvrE
MRHRRLGVSTITLGLVGSLVVGTLNCSRSKSESVASSESEVNWLPGTQTLTFTTIYKSPLVTEGLTADSAGNLYTAGRLGSPCPVWRIPSAGGAAVVVGNLPAPCAPNGLAFSTAGELYVADGSNESNGTVGDRIYKLVPSDTSPPTATLFASGVPGANGIAFDRVGNLWVTDGTTGQGRVWRIAPDGTVSEQFRVPPMANQVNVTDAGTPDGGVPTVVGGVGRDIRALPPGSDSFTEITVAAANTAGSLPIVANDIAFNLHGDALVADTVRGAIWRVEIDPQTGSPTSPTGCDTTFAPDTLCLKNILVQHPLLEGFEGIVLDVAGNMWGVDNERNAIVVVTPWGRVDEIVRNTPDPLTQLRNDGPLEFPTSPFLVGHQLCIAQTDTARRDNFPNKAGEVGTGSLVAKVSCLDQPLPIPGLPLPVK